MKNNSATYRIFRNFLSLTTANVITSFLDLIVVIYLARTLNAEGFGKIGFAQAIIVYFALLTDMGLKTFGTKEIARDKKQLRMYVDNILTMRIVLSAISFSLLFMILALINKPYDIKLLIILYGLNMFLMVFFIDWVFQGVEKMGLIALSNILRSIIYIGFVFSFVHGTMDIRRVPIFLLAGTAGSIIFLSMSFIKNFGFIRLSFNFKLWKKILIQAIPIGLSYIMIKIYYNIDIVMLGFMRTSEEVGWYSAAYKIVFFILTFAHLLGTVIFPNIVRLHNKSPRQLERFLFYISKMAISFGLPVAVGGMILSPEIINLIYGSGYNNSILLLQVLLWSVFAVFVEVPFSLYLLACGRQKQYMYSVTAGATINVISNFFLIPSYGATGAGITTLISEFIVLSMLFLYSQQVISVPVGKNIFGSLLASMVMGGVLLVTKNNMGVGISFLLGVGIYFLSLFFILGESEDREFHLVIDCLRCFKTRNKSE